MATVMTEMIRKTFLRPDETREFNRGKIESLDLAGTRLVKITLQPGWKWSEDLKPEVETKSCQSEHLQYVLQGRLSVVADDGTRTEIGPGDVVAVPRGHDASVIGDEPFVAIDFTGMKEYLSPRPSESPESRDNRGVEFYG
jgi:mannose-6-phosphate isomerase-like protein (cupin superfamily)